MRWLLLVVLVLAGCDSTEPDHGCIGPFYGQPNANGERVVMWECWGGDLPPGFVAGDSLRIR